MYSKYMLIKYLKWIKAFAWLSEELILIHWFFNFPGNTCAQVETQPSFTSRYCLYLQFWNGNTPCINDLSLICNSESLSLERCSKFMLSIPKTYEISEKQNDLEGSWVSPRIRAIPFAAISHARTFALQRWSRINGNYEDWTFSSTLPLWSAPALQIQLLDLTSDGGLSIPCKT